MKVYSYRTERAYYAQHWPEHPLPFLHLEPYLASWLDVRVAFAGKRVLDIGAGECTYTRLIAARFGPARIVACELFQERMLPAARSSDHLGVAFVAGDCFHLPFRDGSFDTVFGSLVLSQLPALTDVAREIRRVLVPGGCYVGIEPHPFNALHVARYLLRPRSANQYLLGRRHLRAFGTEGFRVQLTRFWGRHPRVRAPLLATLLGIVATRSTHAEIRS